MNAARRKLEEATAAMSTAACVFAGVEETIAQFLKEKQAMENIGPVVAPSLFIHPERRAAEALLSPLFEAAENFLRVYKTQMLAAATALPAKEAKHG